MPALNKPDSLQKALTLVDLDYDAADLARHKEVPKIAEWRPFGSVIPLDADESRQLEGIHGLIARYVRHEHQSRPLCLAVFGQPGSGKSFAVKQIL
jgi:hypothetical protein